MIKSGVLSPVCQLSHQHCRSYCFLAGLSAQSPDCLITMLWAFRCYIRQRGTWGHSHTERENRRKGRNEQEEEWGERIEQTNQYCSKWGVHSLPLKAPPHSQSPGEWMTRMASSYWRRWLCAHICAHQVLWGLARGAIKSASFEKFRRVWASCVMEEEVI